MWEFSVSNSSNKLDLFNDCIQRLNHEITLIGGIAAVEIMADRVKMSVAVPEKTIEYFRTILADEIAEIITLDYKYNYLSNNIVLPTCDNVVFEAFVRALTVFDKQTDKDYIKKRIEFSSELYIDSFYSFRLQELKTRWSEIVELVAENIKTLVSSGSFHDLLRFLVKTTPAACGEIHLLSNNDEIDICNDSMKCVGKFCMLNEEGNAKLVGKLVELCPTKIVFHTDNENKLSNYLFNIFDDKVKIVFATQKV